RDVDSIASPVLTFSPVLTDDDLLEVLKSKAASKILAVSKRERIKGDLVKAIIRFGDSRAVASLAANDGAELGVHMGSQLLDIYHDDDLVKESFIARRDLPSPLVEKLITMVSAEVAVRLHEKHGVSVEVATQLANQSRELASIEFMSHSVNAMDLKMWIEQMDEQGRLTNSFIVRAACNGQIPAVVHAFARKTQINTNKASLMVHDSGPFGLKALCVQSGLSDRDFRILRAALLIHADLEIRSGQSTREKFQKTMLERILSLPIAFADDDLEYLFKQLDLVDEY
ncbi:MAG: DUF2336 domain-containing protein, partial [Acidimicrobiales bacterium]